MKKLYTFLLVACSFVFLNHSALTQDFISEKPITAKQNNPGIPYTGNVEWGTDLLVSASEPEGRHSGVYRNSNSTIYVSVPDVNIQAGAGIVILSSTNNGTSWTTLPPSSEV